MSWKIFKGTEAEGPYVGQPTLFIQGIPPYEELAKQILDNQFNCVYFGAQYKQCIAPSPICYEYVWKLLAKGMSVVVDGTIDGYDLIYFLNSTEFKHSIHARAIVSAPRTFDILSVALADWPRNKVWIKIIDYDTKRITLFPFSGCQIPDKSLYEKDELLAEGE